MKKTNKLFLTMCVAGSFALLLGSCKKNEEVKEVTVGLPSFEEEVDERAYVDYANGNVFMWNGNDQIALYNLDNDGLTSQKAIYANDADAEGRTYCKFHYESGDVIGSPKDGYFVFYPAAKVINNPLLEGNYQTFDVPAVQEYTLDPAGTPTMDPNAMALATDLSALNADFSLKHIFGALRMRFKGTAVVNKIVVVDNRYNLNGTATMKLHEVSMETFTLLQNAFIATNDPDHQVAFYGAWDEYKTILDYSATAGDNGKTMTLECGNGVQLNADEETQFIMGLRPGALKYGFKLYVYVNGQTTPLEYVYDTPNWNYGIKAGVNRNLRINDIN